MYDCVDYTRTRLLETIIRKGDNPVFVTNVYDDEGIYISGYYIKDNKPISGKLEEFNLQPIPLGYVNYNKKAIYATRMPMRKDWKQGLRTNNFVLGENRLDRSIKWSMIVNTVKNIYPTFQKAVDKVRNINSLAFHRDFAIHKNGMIEYKGVLQVATYDFDTGNISLNKEWIREALNEAIGV